MASKSDLVTTISMKTGLPKTKAAAAVEAMIEAITDTLRRNDKVTITGFGTFEVKARAAKNGRNPATGESIRIPARRAPTFRAGAGLKDAVS